MTQKEKIIIKFKNNPINLKYNEIETLLNNLGFEKIDTKGSHKKFKNTKLKNDIIIPIYNNDCKDFYKKQLLKTLINHNLI